jgi:hypothetical protein
MVGEGRFPADRIAAICGTTITAAERILAARAVPVPAEPEATGWHRHQTQGVVRDSDCRCSHGIRNVPAPVPAETATQESDGEVEAAWEYAYDDARRPAETDGEVEALAERFCPCAGDGDGQHIPEQDDECAATLRIVGDILAAGYSRHPAETDGLAERDFTPTAQFVAPSMALDALPTDEQAEALEACREQRADLLGVIEHEREERASALVKAWHEGYGAGSSDATDGWTKPGSPATRNPYALLDVAAPACTCAYRHDGDKAGIVPADPPCPVHGVAASAPEGERGVPSCGHFFPRASCAICNPTPSPGAATKD